MRIYVSQPRGFATNLPRHLHRVTRLYRSGVLRDDSTVWINSNVVSPVFWILADRAMCIYWFAAPTSGTVRLTQDRLRWAPSNDDTQKNPLVDLNPSSIPILDDDVRMTFVVDHDYTVPDGGVGVIAGNQSAKMVGGYYEGQGIAVVDLPNFDAKFLPELTASRQEYQQGLAFYNGARLLTAGMSQEDKDLVLDNIADYSVDFDAKAMAQLATADEAFNVASKFAVDSVFKTADESSAAESDSKA